MKTVDINTLTTIKAITKGTIAGTKASWNGYSRTQKAVMLIGGTIETVMLTRLACKRDTKSMVAYGATLVATNTAYIFTGCYKAANENKMNAVKAFVEKVEETIQKDTGEKVVCLVTP